MASVKRAVAAAILCLVPPLRAQTPDAGGAPPPAISPRPGASSAAAHYRRGLRLRISRRRGEALAEFRAAIALCPGGIPAHREYQNLMIDLGLQEEVVRAYGDAARSAPANPAAAYLHGRLLDDPAHQEGAFRRVIALDPRFPWGHYGRGVNLLGRGDRAGAEAEFGKALRLDPSMREARAAMALLDSLAGRHERALDGYRALIGDENAPGELFASALAECRFLRRDAEGEAVSAAAATRFPGSPLLSAHRGYFLSRTGDRAGAIEWYERASHGGPLPPLFARDLRRLYAMAGRHDKAVRLWHGLYGSPLGAADNRLAAPWRRLEEAARAAAVGAGPGVRTALAEAYEGMGWWAEAAAARAAAGESPEGGGSLAADVEWARLLDALDDFGKELDAALRRGSPRISFREAVRRLARAVGDEGGRPRVLPGAVRSRPGMRWFGGAPGRPQPLIERLREGNRELIFFETLCGKRMSFEVAEVVRCAPVPGGDRGRPHREIVCLPSGSGAMDGESGLVYPPLEGFAVFYDPSRWSDLVESREACGEDPLGHSWFLEETGRGPLGARELVFSRMLERRLFEKAFRAAARSGGGTVEARIEDRYAALVAAHERVHLEDLDRFLPVWRHPVRCLGLAARSLFSPRRIERRFEERAAALSLTRGGDPALWLLTVHAQLAGPEDAHRDASRRLLQTIVSRVGAEPAAFPGIDGRRNILNQLYLLDGKALAAIVRGQYGEGR